MDNEKSNPFEVKKDSKVIKMSRYIAPVDFVFNIQSFSSLLGWSTKRIQLGTFESNGFKWGLSLFLSGSNKEENAGEYISFYLSLADVDKLPFGWGVNVNVKFFLFNQSRNKYISFQDGKVWRFHCLRSEFGFEKLLPMSSFNDPSKGYLVDDSCAFGAEIFVVKPNTATFESVDLSKTLDTRTYTWTIKDYSNCETKCTDCLSSPEFVMGGWKWFIKFYPNGISSVVGRSVSLFLHSVCVDSLQVPELEATYKLRIKNQVSGGSEESEVIDHKFCPGQRGYGYQWFMSLEDLKDKSKGYIHNDTLVVEVEFIYLSVIRVYKDKPDN